jgi:MSHA biogenesis protein MshI
MSLFDGFNSFKRATGAGPQPESPWLGVHLGQSGLLGALALPRQAKGDGRPAVRLMTPASSSSLGAQESDTLRGWRKSVGRSSRANVLLRSEEYRVLPIDSPAVPLDEMREAARWQVAEALDFDAEDAALDLISVPSNQANARSQHFVVAAPPEPVQRWAALCRSAQLRLGALDIPEMAMRNLSVLAAGDTAHAFLLIGLHSTRLALIWKRELSSFRQLDVSCRVLEDTPPSEQGALYDRLGLDIQRTADSFARQLAGVELQSLWLASAYAPQAVAEALGQLLPLRIQHFDLERYVNVSGPVPVRDAARGWDHTLAIGAALRQEVLQ